VNFDFKFGDGLRSTDLHALNDFVVVCYPEAEPSGKSDSTSHTTSYSGGVTLCRKTD